MAYETNIRQLPVTARFSSLQTATDRTKAFRQARRHSLLVGFLRMALPLLTTCIAALYFIPKEIKIDDGEIEGTIESIEIDDEGLKMVNPRINGVHEKHGIYDIRASEAIQQIKNTDLIKLNKIYAKLTSKTEETTVLTAPSGLFHSKKEELTFTQGVDIEGNAGFSGKLKTAKAFFQSNKMISSDPVELSFHSSTIQADSMTLYSSEKRAIFKGKVKVHLERAPEKGQE